MRSPARHGCEHYRRLTGLTRRTFLSSGMLSAYGLSLADYLGMQSARGADGARAKSVLLIYTMGGISHHDSFDPKPAAPAEIRGEFGTIPTVVPGVRFSDHVPRLAQGLRNYTLLRSIQHNERDHGVSAYYMLRGYRQPDPSFDNPANQFRANPNIGS